MGKALRQVEAELRLAVAISKVSGIVGDRGGGVGAIALLPFPMPQLPFFLLVARREGN